MPPKQRSPKNTNPDPRVARLLTFFCERYEAEFDCSYMPAWARDGDLMRRSLKYADAAVQFPEGRSELGLAVAIDDWLERQKAAGQFAKYDIPGWRKDFNRTVAEIRWHNIDWQDVEQKYELVQKQAKERRKPKRKGLDRGTPGSATF